MSDDRVVLPTPPFPTIPSFMPPAYRRTEIPFCVQYLTPEVGYRTQNGKGGPACLGPGALEGRTVLVAGGAGAVGHAAIELAVWSGATVVSTVSSPAKADLASAAGAHHVVNYRTGDPSAAIRGAAPDGVDLIVEVAPVANAALDRQVPAGNATVAIYARDGDELTVPVFSAMRANTRLQFVLVYSVAPSAKERAVGDVSAAVAAGGRGRRATAPPVPARTHRRRPLRRRGRRCWQGGGRCGLTPPARAAP